MTKTRRARYTLEFKREAVRLVEGGQSMAAAARTFGIVEQTLFNRVKANRQGKLSSVCSQSVSAEQMEIVRLRAKLTRVKMERDIAGKRDGVLCKGIQVKYAFIERNRCVWPISVQCRVLKVSVAGYYGHFVRRARDVQQRCLSSEALLVHIKAIHAETQVVTAGRALGKNCRPSALSPGARPRTRSWPGCSGTTEHDCTRRWLMSVRCRLKKTGNSCKPVRSPAMGYGSQGQGHR